MGQVQWGMGVPQRRGATVLDPRLAPLLTVLVRLLPVWYRAPGCCSQLPLGLVYWKHQGKVKGEKHRKDTKRSECGTW